jgi:general stress protein 26
MRRLAAIKQRGRMSKGTREQESREVGRLLAGASKTIEDVRYCWLLSGGDGGIRARPMGRLLTASLRDDWTIRFVTDRRSSKAEDVRQSGAVSLILQNDRDEAYVALAGNARLIEAVSDVRALWKDAFAPYFPTETDRANAGFIEVGVTRLELWIRGVTPEPFGLRTTLLERDPQGAWHLRR